MVVATSRHSTVPTLVLTLATSGWCVTCKCRRSTTGEGSQYHNEDGSVWMRFKAGTSDSQAADGNVDINNNHSQFQLGGDVLTLEQR